MALRIALVIDGETKGATEALKTTSDGIKDLGQEAKTASGAVEGITENLGATGDGAADAASEVSKVGEAASGAGGKFIGLKDVAAGAMLDIAAGIATAGIGAAIGALTTAFTGFVNNIISSGPAIEAALGEQKQLFEQFKASLDELDGGPSSFGANNIIDMEAQTQQTLRANIEAYQKELLEVKTALEVLGTSGTVSVFGLFDTLAGELEGSPFEDVTRQMIADIDAGTINIVQARDQLNEIYTSLGEDSPFKDAGGKIRDAVEVAVELQTQLKSNISFYEGIAGDANKLIAAVGDKAQSFNGLTTSIDNVNRVLEHYQSLWSAIGYIPGASSVPASLPAPAPAQPFALGGVVSQPTLFSFGDGETGLAGEAGEEAILPMTAGKVGARGASGREFQLGLARLSSGELGVDFASPPVPFAKGGVVSRFASGGVVSGASGGSFLSGGFGRFGSRIAALIAELSAIGQTAEFGAEIVEQLNNETLARDEAIDQSPERIAAIEGEAAAIGAMSGELEGQNSLLDTARGAWSNFFVEIGRATADGTVTAKEWGSAVAGAFDTLRDKALALAAEGIFDLIADAFTGGTGGGGGGALGDVLGALLGSLFGFDKGGWTGDGPTNQIAGGVHGQEFVVRAGPARANRGVLEAMNAGQSFGGGSAFSPNTTVNIYGSGVSMADVERSLDARDRALAKNFGVIQANAARRASPGMV